MKNENCKMTYSAPLWEELESKGLYVLVSLSMDGEFDEVGFEAEDNSNFGWGNERSDN